MFSLRWIHTSDIHGALFLEDKEKSQRETRDTMDKDIPSDNIILSDGGDQLQGNTVTYYCNHLSDASQPHIIAETMNSMKYDVACLGNHDIEAGKEACNRWIDACNFPILGANVIDEKSGEPALKPYTIIVRENIRIAVLGIVTTAIPHWLHNNLWKGWKFADTVKTAKKWIEILQRDEHPDMIVGLFHTGWEGGMFHENETRRIAENVAGFDLILYGHDHHQATHTVRNGEGRDVLCLAPSSMASSAVVADIRINKEKENKCEILINHKIVPWNEVEHLLPHQKMPQCVMEWQNKMVCTLENDVYERDAFFGSSAFVDIMHNMLRATTKAQVSFASPVSYDTIIRHGKLTNSSMFRLYPFETQTYIMRMSGEEIRKALEYSYSLWVNTMQSQEDDALLLDYVFDEGSRKGLKTLSFDLLSAGGIRYSVWLNQEVGSRIKIESMDDGTRFDLNATYTVAINSYHGNGGGDIMTIGTGLSTEILAQRIEQILPLSTREYLTRYLQSLQKVTLKASDNWSFMPETLVTPALEREKHLLFEECK